MLTSLFIGMVIVPSQAKPAGPSSSDAKPSWTKSSAIIDSTSARFSSDLHVKVEDCTAEEVLVTAIDYPDIPYVQDMGKTSRTIWISNPNVTISEFKRAQVGDGSYPVWYAILKPNGVKEFEVKATLRAQGMLYKVDGRRIAQDPEVSAYMEGLLGSIEWQSGWKQQKDYQEYMQRNLPYTGQDPWQYLWQSLNLFGKTTRAWLDSNGAKAFSEWLKTGRTDCDTLARFMNASWQNIGLRGLRVSGQYPDGKGHIINLLEISGCWYPFNGTKAFNNEVTRNQSLYSSSPFFFAAKSIPGLASIKFEGTSKKIDVTSHQGNGIDLTPLKGGMTTTWKQNDFYVTTR